MERDQDQKHKCKFCSKSFPCGRSLGGHMRSHLINLSPSDRKKTNEKLPKKKLHPDSSTDGGDQFASYGLRDNPKKTSKFTKTNEGDALLEEKTCKECGKSFQSWKALFGHMKCHSVNGKVTTNVDQDSWHTYDHDHDDKVIMDSQSDNETATPLCRKKRSGRITKRYTSNTNSSSLTEIDHHQEEEEVALSLIILSRDKGKWSGVNSFDESSDHSFEPIESDQAPKMLEIESKSSGEECLKIKKLEQIETKSPPKDKKKPRKRKPIDANPFCSDSQPHNENEKTSKFACSICKKAFPSYQALGGHRASHKKFKGLCAPRSENSLETESSHIQIQIQTENLITTNKGHECPICSKVFSSGQALGGHKRSHLIVDHTKNNPTVEKEEPIHEIRGFLDLNLPAPNEEEEEECNEFMPWWIATSHEQPLIGLLSR